MTKLQISLSSNGTRHNTWRVLWKFTFFTLCILVGVILSKYNSILPMIPSQENAITVFIENSPKNNSNISQQLSKMNLPGLSTVTLDQIFQDNQPYIAFIVLDNEIEAIYLPKTPSEQTSQIYKNESLIEQPQKKGVLFKKNNTEVTIKRYFKPFSSIIHSGTLYKNSKTIGHFNVNRKGVSIKTRNSYEKPSIIFAQEGHTPILHIQHDIRSLFPLYLLPEVTSIPAEIFLYTDSNGLAYYIKTNTTISSEELSTLILYLSNISNLSTLAWTSPNLSYEEIRSGRNITPQIEQGDDVTIITIDNDNSTLKAVKDDNTISISNRDFSPELATFTNDDTCLSRSWYFLNIKAAEVSSSIHVPSPLEPFSTVSFRNKLTRLCW